MVKAGAPTGLSRRERILASGCSALRDLGCYALRMDDVADMAGVAKGTVYLEFDGKRGLLSEMLDEACTLVSGLIERMDRPEVPAATALRDVVVGLLDTASSRPCVFLLAEGRLGCAATWICGDVSGIESVLDLLERLISRYQEESGTRTHLLPEVGAEAVLTCLRVTAVREMLDEGRVGDAARQVLALVGAVSG